jgi:hypothetical protein
LLTIQKEGYMQRNSVRWSMLLAAVSALAACSGSPTATTRTVAILPTQAAYTVGSNATLEVRNLGAHELGYNLCGQQLQRRTSGGWHTEATAPGPGVACTLELRLLPTGASVAGLVALPTTLPAGTYRVIFAGILYPHDGTLAERDRTSASFEVTRNVRTD